MQLLSDELSTTQTSSYAEYTCVWYEGRPIPVLVHYCKLSGQQNPWFPPQKASGISHTLNYKLINLQVGKLDIRLLETEA